jgi:hypothetical protein
MADRNSMGLRNGVDLCACAEVERNAEPQLETGNHLFGGCRTPMLCKDATLQQRKREKTR